MREDQLRAAMVRSLLDAQRIRTPAVERAFRSVPRHLFLPEQPIERAYQDEAVLTKWQDGVAVSSASQPSMMAIMLEQLALRAGDRVLEIGAGTGYNAALMAQIVGPTGQVVSVDIDQDLVDGAARYLASAGVSGVTLVTADGASGVPELAPYDRIVLTVGSWDIQRAWWSQLAAGGRLLLPLSVRGSQLSVALDLVDGAVPCLLSDSLRSCAFVRLRGEGADPEGSVPLADGLAVHAVDNQELNLDALSALLAEPGAERLSAVRLAAVDLWDGFGLWLSVHTPDMCRLLVSPDVSGWWPSLLAPGVEGGTLLLLGDQGLAMVAPTGDTDVPMDTAFPVSVRGYGPGGPEAAQRMDQLLDAWSAAGRPTATGLRLRAYPSDVTLPAGQEPVLRKAHSQLVLDWPGNPVPGGPILER